MLDIVKTVKRCSRSSFTIPKPKVIPDKRKKKLEKIYKKENY